MSHLSITDAVDRGIAIRVEMLKLRLELATIEARLVQAGYDGPKAPLEDADREGQQYLAHGTRKIVPIVFTADLIQQTFKWDSPKHRQLEALANGKLDSFFKEVRGFESILPDGKAFRVRAAELLGQDAPPFITAAIARNKAGIPKSDVKIAWDRAKDTEGEPQ